MGTLVPETALAVLKRNERTLQNPCCTSHHGGCTQQGGVTLATAEGGVEEGDVLLEVLSYHLSISNSINHDCENLKGITPMPPSGNSRPSLRGYEAHKCVP